MFGETVGQIGCSWFTKHVVVTLEDLILYKIELNIHCFGNFFQDGVICYPLRGQFIYMNGRCLLWVAYLIKGDYDWFPCFGVVKQLPNF